MNIILEDLKEYFKNTPKEQIEKDWAKYGHLDKIGPSVDEFLANQQDLDPEVNKIVNDNFWKLT